MILAPADITAIVGGQHGDPFAVLGPHRVKARGRSGIAVRAFLPGATVAQVVSHGEAPREMEQVHPDGLFEALFPKRQEPFPYRLRVVDAGGQIADGEDPYRFPPVLSDYDLHLLGEGTYGPPEDFMYFVDCLHRHGIGVILDWVPAHFPRDTHGLALFDGTHLYEHADPRQGEHPEWGTLVFNYGRNEVANFLIGNALFWLDRYHVDGLRVDAVASMLYLDYARPPGEWIPNRHGGRENLEAIAFLKRFNEVVYRYHPDVMTIAEESTAWPLVSRPTHVGGLGFGFKWNMGWMHDILDYMGREPVHRKYHHDRLTFGLLYAWHENFILPLSHDEVVYGKGALHQKMPGDDWQKFANLRCLYAFMYGHPGKKLLFMGGEFGQTREWYHEESLAWPLLRMGPYHEALRRLVRDLNRLYRSEAALHQVDDEPEGFQWIDCSDWEESVVSFVRRARDPRDFLLFVCNFTPIPRHRYHVGAPAPGFYRELLNTDAQVYGGSNVGNAGRVHAEPAPHHGQPHRLVLTLPPLATVAFRPSGG